MDNKSSIQPDNEKLTQSSQNNDSVDPSVENGKKAIDIQNKIEEKSEEDKAKDADQWRNEG
jgi:hypothetical protein